MPILSFTEGDKLSAVVVEKGWYPVAVTEIKTNKPNDKGNITYPVTLTVQSGPRKGKEFEIMLNTGTTSSSLLGGRQFVPDNWFLMLQAATRGIKLDDVQLENFDTDDLMNKPFDVFVIQETSEGILCNMVSQFAPVGKGEAVAVTF